MTEAQTETVIPQAEHQHGGDPSHAFARLGVSPRPVLDFSVNVNPLGPPSEVLASLKDWQHAIDRYPSARGNGIIRFYTQQWNLPSEAILPGNGSVSLIYSVLFALRLQRLCITTPSFHEYTRAAAAALTTVVPLHLSDRNGFAPLSPACLSSGLKDSNGLMVGHPNNPTGTFFPTEYLMALAQHYRDKWFLVDEAFVEFTEDPAAQSLLCQQPLPRNILVFRSLTKFYALPGLRMGAVIGHPETIRMLQYHQAPWSVNHLAEQAAPALLNAGDYEAETRHWITCERARLLPLMQRLKGMFFYPPTANFVLARWMVTPNLDDLLNDLLQQGFYLRDCRNFPGLEKNYFRFALRQAQDNDRLLTAMARSIEHHHV